ncbi:MAG: hypothetical protein IRY95_00480, partial [Clostridia bacterium]|nr:hypothetical protein [Clostridia bacterium]
GLLTGVRRTVTRGGDMMAFATLEDLTGSVEVAVFPRTFQRCREAVVEDNLVVVHGRVSWREETVSLVAEDVRPALPSRGPLPTSLPAVEAPVVALPPFPGAPAEPEPLPPVLPPAPMPPAPKSPEPSPSTPPEPSAAVPDDRAAAARAARPGIWIDVGPRAGQRLLQELQVVLRRYPGPTPVYLELGRRTLRVDRRFWARPEAGLLQAVEELVGTGRVRVVEGDGDA